jgi:hypothetical protein
MGQDYYLAVGSVEGWGGGGEKEDNNDGVE